MPTCLYLIVATVLPVKNIASKGDDRSTASYILVVAKQLVPGNCSVNPTEGFVGDTLFSVLCSGFNDVYGALHYTMYLTGQEIEDANPKGL